MIGAAFRKVVRASGADVVADNDAVAAAAAGDAESGIPRGHGDRPAAVAVGERSED